MANSSRDNVRWAAWGSAIAVSATLLFAGFVHQPRPSLDTVFSCAEFQARVGLLDEARVGLMDVLERDPDHQHAHLLMGWITMEDGAFGAALRHYMAGESAVRASASPELIGDWTLTTAELKLYTGDFSGAERAADSLIALAHRPAAALLIRAFSRLGVGDDTDFRQDLRRAHLTNPTDPFFRARREFLAAQVPWATAFTIDPERGFRP